MNQPPPTEKQTGKRIVSKGEYVKGNIMRSSMALTSIFLFSAAAVCGLGILLALLLFCASAYLWSDPEYQSMLQVLINTVVVIFPLGIGMYLCGKGACIVVQKAATIDPGVYLTRANIADFSALDSLVRASEEPRQEQQAVLLRAATESVERHEEQLVRASAGEAE